jgi:two-component sensor histidine kinase
LKEKEILLQEVNHRVKNNLQVILSLFTLQGESTNDPERIAMLSEIRLRIQSMAMIHEKIYKSEAICKRSGNRNFSYLPHIFRKCPAYFRNSSCFSGN